MNIATPAPRLFIPALFAALTACSGFGPPRTAPPIPPPAHYAAEQEKLSLPAADGIAQQLQLNVAPLAQWWSDFHSPELDAWVEEGLRNSPSLAATRGTLESARQQLKSQIGNSLWPKVDLGFAPSRQRALGIPVLPQQTLLYDVFAAEAQASYTFDFFGAALLADRSLGRQVEQQGYELQAARRALATNIVVAAIDAAALQAQLSASESLATLGERRAELAAARFRLGSASRSEMLSAAQDAAALTATVPALHAQLLAVRHTQAVLMGRSPDQAPPPLPLEELQLPQSVPLSVPSALLHQRPDILAAEAAVRASADAAGAAAASLYPSLTLSAAYGRGGFDWSTFASPAGAIWSVGASLTQPLFHGGALRARKKQYEAAYDAAVAQYRQTVLAAFQSVADTLVSLEEDANALAAYQRAVDAARDQEQDARARQLAGSLPLAASLAADEDYQSAYVAYVRARASRLAHTAALYDAMGLAAGGSGSSAQ